ncbi:MAG: PHP domain-containing protein [Candidatus Aminicenantes bacterium]|nr:PHP domain-containing protein [Candidatus Aminicenantes bacterium]
MKPGFVDFHIHSTFSSDGEFTTAQIVAMARAAGFVAVSFADHDTVAAYPEAIALGRAVAVEVIPGMEVTTTYEGREFHCLLPLLDWSHPAVARISAAVSDGRWIEARERVDHLRRLGLDLTWEEVAAAVGATPPLGVKIAQVLLDKPESRRDPRLAVYYDESGRPRAPKYFYIDYFMEGKPAFVPKRHIPLLDVLDQAPASGAVPVLSHPGAYFQNTTRADLAKLRARGLEGLEVFTSYHDQAQTRFYADAARDFGLVATAGSDFHGRVKPQVPFGLIRDGHYGMINELRTRRRADHAV